MGSLEDAINEEPNRFLGYLKLKKIFNSKNPYQEFLRQFEKAFGSKQGLNLWQYVVGKYRLLNKLYKEEKMQEGLPKEFKGALKKEEVRKYFEKREEEIRIEQEESDRKAREEKKGGRHKYDD